MNNRDFIKELLTLSDDALKHLNREPLSKYREVGKAYSEGKEVEYRNSLAKDWRYVKDPSFVYHFEYRIKRKTININGYEVPEPFYNPKEGDRVWYPSSMLDSSSTLIYCENINVWFSDKPSLGIFFRTKEDCDLYREAVLSLTKEKK